MMEIDDSSEGIVEAAAVRAAVAFDMSLEHWSANLERLAYAVHDYARSTDELHNHNHPMVTTGPPNHVMKRAYDTLDHSLHILDDIEASMLRAKRNIARIRNHSMTLVPINRIYPALMSEIFMLALEQQEIDLVKQSSESVASSASIGVTLVSPMPVVLSHVCRFWRTVALDTPRLWSKVDFSDPPPYEFSKVLLERSKRAPLTISLSLTDGHNHEKIDEVTKLIVPQHSSRVESLTINAIDVEQLQRILGTFINDADVPPPLVELSLIALNSAGELLDVRAHVRKKMQLIQMMAGIQAVHLEGVHLPWASPTFKNLRYLRLASNSMDDADSRPTETEFIAILTASPLLHSIIIHETGIRMDNPQDPEHCKRHTPIEMTKLHELELTEVSWDEMAFVLHLIRAPELRALRICQPEERCDGDGDPISDEQEVVDRKVLQALHTFLDHTRPAVTELSMAVPSPELGVSSIMTLQLESITGEELGSERLTAILAKIPLVEMLSLQDMEFNDDVLNQMHGVWGPHVTRPPGLENDVLCPKLDRLKLFGNESITTLALVSLASFRANRGTPIHTIRLADLSEDLNLYHLKRSLMPFVKALIIEDEDGEVLA